MALWYYDDEDDVCYYGWEDDEVYDSPFHRHNYHDWEDVEVYDSPFHRHNYHRHNYGSSSSGTGESDSDHTYTYTHDSVLHVEGSTNIDYKFYLQELSSGKIITQSVRQ